MKPIYVPYSGDLYTVFVNDSGIPLQALVSRDNCSRPPEPIELYNIPRPVFEILLDKMVRQNERKPK